MAAANWLESLGSVLLELLMHTFCHMVHELSSSLEEMAVQTASLPALLAGASEQTGSHPAILLTRLLTPAL